MSPASKLLVVLVAIALTACSNGPRLGESPGPMAVSKLAELPAPTGADLVVASSPYRIGPSTNKTQVEYLARNPRTVRIWKSRGFEFFQV